LPIAQAYEPGAAAPQAWAKPLFFEQKLFFGQTTAAKNEKIFFVIIRIYGIHSV